MYLLTFSSSISWVSDQLMNFVDQFSRKTVPMMRRMICFFFQYVINEYKCIHFVVVLLHFLNIYCWRSLECKIINPITMCMELELSYPQQPEAKAC